MRNVEHDDVFVRVALELVDAGHSVVAGPLRLRQPDDPVFDRFRAWRRRAGDGDVEAWWKGDLARVSERSGIPLDELDAHTPLSDLMLLLEVADALDITPDRLLDHPVAEALGGWLASFGSGRLVDPDRPDLQVRPATNLPGRTLREQSPLVSDTELASILSAPPTSTWIVTGTEQNFLTNDDLDETRTWWSAPQRVQPGDVVLIHFPAPLQGVHFVARAASYAHFDEGTESIGRRKVETNTWWVELTHVTEISPVRSTELQKAVGGRLVLRGKTAHHVPHDAVRRLLRARPDLRAVVPIAARDARLPAPEVMSLHEWRLLAGGVLADEREVWNHVAAPAVRFAIGDLATLRETGSLAGGLTGHVVRGDDSIAAVVDVRQRAHTPVGDDDWAASDDVQHLLAELDDLDLPGLLVDAHHVHLFEPGAKAPKASITRRDATRRDVSTLRRHLLPRDD